MKPTLGMKNLIAMVQHRMRADFRLGVYLYFGALAVLVLLPISVVRLMQGADTNALLNFALVAFVLGATAHAWRGGNLDRLGIVVAIGMTTGGCFSIYIGGGGIYWLYPILLASAFMAGPRTALALLFVVLGFLWLQGDAIARTGHSLAVMGSMLVSGTFALIFASRSMRRQTQLELLATIDPLTGAENRRALELALEVACFNYRRDGRPVALAMIDLDHFKKVNDRFGHEVGDRVLSDFVRLVQASVRRTDRLFRYGGEEFVLLLPGTDELGLELAMNHLRTRIRAGLTLEGAPVTVSIGGAILRAGETREAWFRRADEALYRAKESGRDRLDIEGALD